MTAERGKILFGVGSAPKMMALDLGAVKDLLANKKGLDAKLRDHVRANAAKAFDDLEKEEAKRGP